MTKTPTRILVATDMSARSDRAVERALQLAGLLDIPVEVLLVLDDALPANLLAPLHEKAESQLDVICKRAAEGHSYHLSVQAGDPTEEILKAAEPSDTTLLVMGPHRPRPFLDGLRETTMQRVVRRTSAPVLLAKVPVTGPYEATLSLVDYSPISTGALQLGAKLSPKAPVTAVHAVNVPYSGMLETTGSVQMDLQAAFLEDAKTMDATWRDSGNLPDTLTSDSIIVQAPAKGLVQESTRGGAYDLITAGAHGRVGAARSYLGSIALDLMRDPPCDVLIARA